MEKSEIFYECPVIPDKKKMLSSEALGIICYLSSAGMNRFQLLKTIHVIEYQCPFIHQLRYALPTYDTICYVLIPEAMHPLFI